MARNFSKSQSLYSGGASTTMSLRVVCSQLVFGEVTSPNTRPSEVYCSKLTGRVWSFWSLFGGDKKVTPRTSHLALLGASSTGCNRRKGKLNIFSNPRACIEAELRIFPSPRELRRRLRRGIFPSPRVCISLYRGGA